MEELDTLVENLTAKKLAVGCGAMETLLEMSRESAGVYLYLDRFLEMTESDNSYIRTRGLLLTAANARWDTDCRIDGGIDRLLTHVMDPKPITARQFIAVLPVLAADKPELREDIRAALLRANPGQYVPSMAPLVAKDIQAALLALESGKTGNEGTPSGV